NADAQCGGATSGQICNATVCAAGCSTAAGRNYCPSGQYCSNQSGGVGSCLPQPCMTDPNCSAPTPFCDTDPEPNACIQCRSSADCSGTKPFCDATNTCAACATDANCPNALQPACQASGACAECSATNASRCGGVNPVCLTGSGTCGCNADSRCGSSTSGQICGAGATCVAGCSTAAGRNYCPATEYCSNQSGGVG